MAYCIGLLLVAERAGARAVGLSSACGVFVCHYVVIMEGRVHMWCYASAGHVSTRRMGLCPVGDAVCMLLL